MDERREELSQAQADLSRALDQERELSELKSRFVNMVSHEFRAPLGIIMSAIELTRHHKDRLPDEQRVELEQGCSRSRGGRKTRLQAYALRDRSAHG